MCPRAARSAAVAGRIAHFSGSPDGSARLVDLELVEREGGRPAARILDTFPMTSHVECVTILEPAAKGL